MGGHAPWATPNNGQGILLPARYLTLVFHTVLLFTISNYVEPHLYRDFLVSDLSRLGKNPKYWTATNTGGFAHSSNPGNTGMWTGSSMSYSTYLEGEKKKASSTSTILYESESKMTSSVVATPRFGVF